MRTWTTISGHEEAEEQDVLQLYDRPRTTTLWKATNMTNATLPRGFSDEARYVAETTKESYEHLGKSATFSKQPAYDELGGVWDECNKPNWDCHDAMPVEQDALRNAYMFIEALPLGTPLPSIGAEPDGHLTIEWYRNPRWTLSISVSPEGTLYYAGLFGTADVRGSESFFGEVPEIIRSLIQRVCAA